MTEKIRNKIQKARERSYLAKDFNGFRNQLLNYARVYFPDKIKDFSLISTLAVPSTTVQCSDL